MGLRLQLTVAVLAVFVIAVAPASAQTPAAPGAQPSTSTSASAASTRITAYTLPPERAKKAHDLSQIYFRYSLISFFYGLVALWLILRARLAPKYRDWAEQISSRRFLQVLVFSPLLILTLDLLELPLGIYRHWLSASYGLSISSWPTWFWDWIKAELVTIVGGTILIWILWTVIRHSPRRWWIWFWAASLPLGAFLVFLTPLILDPLFHKFEPTGPKGSRAHR